MVHEFALVEPQRGNPATFRLLQAASRNHNVKMRVEIQVSSERMRHDQNEHPDTIGGFHPLLDHRCRECWQVMEKSAILAKNWPQYIGHCKADTGIGNIRKGGPLVALPEQRSPLPTTRA